MAAAGGICRGVGVFLLLISTVGADLGRANAAGDAAKFDQIGGYISEGAAPVGANSEPASDPKQPVVSQSVQFVAVEQILLDRSLGHVGDDTPAARHKLDTAEQGIAFSTAAASSQASPIEVSNSVLVQNQGSNGNSPASTSEAEAPSTHVAVSEEYLVGPGDLLEVVVWQHPDLSVTVPVRPDGRVSLPLVEDLLVENKTSTAIAREIESALRRYIQDPIVNVTVSGLAGALSQRIRVIGEAVSPTAIPYREGLSLLDVVIAAGGLSPFADGNRAIVVRQQEGLTRQIPVRLDDLIDKGDASANITMDPGDVLIIPQGFFSGNWTYQRSGLVSLQFTDNVDLDPDDEAQSAVITEFGPGFSAIAETARVNGAITSQTNLRQEFSDESSLGFRPSLAGIFNWEVLSNLFFVDTAASVSRQTLDSRDPDADVNQDTTVTYSVSPYLVNQLGNFATSEARYSLIQTFIPGSEDTSDTTTNELSLTLDSGPQFTTWLWTLGALGSHTSESDSDESSEVRVDLDTEYIVSNSFSLLGGVGYENLDESGSANDIEGPTWHTGFRWFPGPRTELRLTYGRRNGENSPAGSLRHEFGPYAILTASYVETVETGQESLAADLSSIGVDPETGELISVETGQDFDPNTSPFSITDEPRRRRSLLVGLNGEIGRNSYLLTAAGEEEGPVDDGTDETSYGVGAAWSRELSLRSSIELHGEYERSEFDIDGQTNEDYTFGASFNYNLYENVSSRVGYRYRLRASTVEEDEFTENLAFVTVIVVF